MATKKQQPQKKASRTRTPWNTTEILFAFFGWLKQADADFTPEDMAILIKETKRANNLPETRANFPKIKTTERMEILLKQATQRRANEKNFVEATPTIAAVVPEGETKSEDAIMIFYKYFFALPLDKQNDVLKGLILNTADDRKRKIADVDSQIAAAQKEFDRIRQHNDEFYKITSGQM